MAKSKPAPRTSPGKPAAGTSPGKMISIRGAREHNLKNVDLDLPRDSLIASADLFGSSPGITE